MSTDEKEALKKKHNAYKENKPGAELPAGMEYGIKPETSHNRGSKR